jgi:hypothetical protein
LATEQPPEPVVIDKSRDPKPKRQFAWPKLNLLRRKPKPPTDEGSHANGHVEVPVRVVPEPNGHGAASIPDLPGIGKPERRTRKLKRASPRKWLDRLRRPQSDTKKQKQVKKPISTRALHVIAAFLLFVVPPVALIRAVTVNSKVKVESNTRHASDARIEGQLKQLGASSVFPLAQAIAMADSLAYECFTVPTALPNPSNEDAASLQDKALSYDGIPAGDKVNCGWDGKGRGKLDDHQVVSDPYWVHADHATVVMQLKLYQRPGKIYFYVPFTNNNGIPKIAGMPAIFGWGSGAEDFMSTCGDPSDSVDIEPLRHTAQLFLNALAGEKNIDLGYLVYKDAKFGGFGPSVTSPKVTEAKYCGSKDNERRFAALVQFNGPVAGAHYTLPYGFVMVPNPQTSGKYQVKDFGPAPGYTGE